jgi:WD40 repeat protein
LFFSGGWDSTVQVWDIRVAKQSVRKICGPSVSADSLDLKKGVLLAGNYQNNDIVQMYDFKSGDLIQTLDIKEPHNSNSYCFAASYAHRSEHNLIAVALTGSNKVKIINNLEVISEIKFQAAPLCLDFYRFNNKDFLIVGGV